MGGDCSISASSSRRALSIACPECSKDSLKTLFQQVDIREADFLAVESAIENCVEAAFGSGGAKNLFPCILRRSPNIINLVPLASDVISCQLAQEACYSDSDLQNNPGLFNLLIQSKRFKTIIDLILLPFSGYLTNVIDVVQYANSTLPTPEQTSDFSTVIVNALGDDSENGKAISASELQNIVGAAVHSPSDADLMRFSSAWNSSSALWDSGVFRTADLPANYSLDFFDLSVASELMVAFQNAQDSIKQESFSGLADAWLSAVEAREIEEAKRLAGVCASVRVQIQQELTLTRVGFEAQLEILNDGSFPLENVSVSLRATIFGNSTEEATELFVFDDPDLAGVSAVDGTGTMATNTQAKATWLILPLTAAAPMFDTKYDVGGVLTYTIDGVKYVQVLAPDTITVRPDPQLYLTYFHSRIAYSDDPFTPDIVEPTIPFQLGLIIENRGYGTANDVEIISSQPEIIENEKGLLVDFSIIGARLGNEPTANTLKIDFGTIEPQSNVVGVWDLV